MNLPRSLRTYGCVLSRMLDVSQARQPLAGHGRHAEFSFQQTQEEHMRKSLAVFLSGVALAIAASTALSRRAGTRVQARHQTDRLQDNRGSQHRGPNGRVRKDFRRRRLQGRPHRCEGVRQFLGPAQGFGPVLRLQHLHVRGWLDHGALHRLGQGRPVNGRVYDPLGTGAYANATGTGTIESAPNPFKGVNLLNIKLVVKTPGT